MEVSRSFRPTWASVFIVAALFTTSILAQNTTKCYAPNGQEATYSNVGTGTDLLLYACPAGDDGFATCCTGTDFCQPNNLCYNLNNGAPVAYRQYCTDPTWESDNCSDLCRTAGEANANISGGVGLSPCGDAKFCCGWFNTDCCENHEGTYAVAGFQVGLGNTHQATTTVQGTATASIPSTTATISNTQSTTSSAIGATSTQESNSASSSPTFGREAIAGVAVGAAGATAIFALAGVLFWRRHKTVTAASRDLPPTNQSEHFPPTWGDQHSYQQQQFADSTKPDDVYGHHPMELGYTPEMAGAPVRFELQGK
ncbi:hypothetical protein E8E14_002350 [Neopestalotiopsis sp. 37M]|nr:hypothetical protein E8E14_002350 [Neopestalotiopsis sp. 37M]